MKIGTLPAGTRGFDCNQPVGPLAASKFVAAGFRFAVRYLKRDVSHGYDLTRNEVYDLLSTGLGVMAVQHVAPPGWHPTGALGQKYGETAAIEAKLAGLLPNTTVWLDLEGVARSASPADVALFCNEWYAAVAFESYSPGIYVGDSCGLTANQLYHTLRFKRYWAAYNLNRDDFPAVRGVQMRQSTYPPFGSRVDVHYEYDVDMITKDSMGDLPAILLP